MTDVQDIAISVRDLKTFFYTNNRCNKALNGVSFDIKKGKTLCIVGESGCGKSVTAASIMQLLPRLSRIEDGQVIYHSARGDIDLHALEKNGRQMRRIRGAEIAMVYQEPMAALNPSLTIETQLIEVPMYHEGISASEARTRAIAIHAFSASGEDAHHFVDQCVGRTDVEGQHVGTLRSLRNPGEIRDATEVHDAARLGRICHHLPMEEGRQWRALPAGCQIAGAKVRDHRAARTLCDHRRVSDLKRGKIAQFSLDTLVKMAGDAGYEVGLTVHRAA